MIFGVPFFARECAKVAERYGVEVHYQHNLVAVDAKAKTRSSRSSAATTRAADQRPYDMLHVSPPQSPPDDISSSPLANAAGLVEVNQTRCSTCNIRTYSASASHLDPQLQDRRRGAQTGAGGGAQHSQADQRPASTRLRRYASCPLTTANGKVMIAEFIYGGKPTPTLPIGSAQGAVSSWAIKAYGLPIMYWDYMLKGYEAFPKHNTAFKEPTLG